MSLPKLLLFLVLFYCQQPVFAQYILNGSAQQNSCNCYTLTKPELTKTGSVWNSNKINLNTSFDFWFNVFLGCDDAGADGIVFILQPISTSVGTSGGGMGFGGVVPSVGIALDTYTNPDLQDPIYDHISIQSNGVVNHANDLAGPVPISATSDNVEDCQWHKLRIVWDASNKRLQTYFDGVLRLEKQVDLIATIFNNDPNVYWGFTGATGGMVNLQQFCTALDPIFSTNFTNNVLCEGEQVTFSNTSESFAPIASYLWNFGDGSTSTLPNPPPHLYAAPGVYNVSLKIKGMDGCERDSSKTITVASIPSADLQVYDTCYGNAPRLEFVSNNFDVSYNWELNGTPVPGNQQPSLNSLPEGNYNIQVQVRSDYGCGPTAVGQTSFVIKPNPSVNSLVSDGCVNVPLFFQGVQTDAATTIDQWTWVVNGDTVYIKDLQQQFSQPAEYTLQLWAEASNGCRSDTVENKVKIAKAQLFVRDTVLVQNYPSQLTAIGNGNIAWSPSTGLSNPFSDAPIATLSQDQDYKVTVTTPEGCREEKLLKVKVYKGPTVYVPSAFSPNGDGKNEFLLPVYVGIKTLKEFAVFNRWGNKVFATNDLHKAWTGNGTAGTFVWLVQAVDVSNKPISLKGTVTIIR